MKLMFKCFDICVIESKFSWQNGEYNERERMSSNQDNNTDKSICNVSTSSQVSHKAKNFNP